MPPILRLYVPVFSFTLLLSAALLFSIQPMFSKMILPLLGGSPQVWNTAMLFFQAMLLGGYAYAHGTTRFLSVRAQAVLHIVLLAVCLVFLPITITQAWTSMRAAAYPIIWQFGLMMVTLGGPFFVLSGSAPMLQRWFAASGHKDARNPYFLYAASNMGSMAALLAYPVIIEPLLTLPEQSRVWSMGYMLLIAMTGIAAFLSWRGHESARINASQTALSPPLTAQTCLSWIALAFIPSSLMLGVTTYITTDIASVPLLWILPLALYVATFIFVFASKPPFTLKIINIFHFIFLCLALFTMMNPVNFLVRVAILPVHLALFFFSAMLCHTRLAMLRPPPQQLTVFYLFMSLGGVLGGIFNALIAPYLFIVPVEYTLMLALVCLFRSYPSKKSKNSKRSDEVVSKLMVAIIIGAAIAPCVSFIPAFSILSAVVAIIGLLLIADQKWHFLTAVSVVLLIYSGFKWKSYFDGNIHVVERNFFGIKTVQDNTYAQTRGLIHGNTLHGIQALNDPYKLLPLSYYHPSSSADYFGLLDKTPAPQRIGVIGLGTGTLACYRKEGRHYDFYEIDPQVIEIAKNPEYFTFLKDCGSPYTIIEGDGRLKIKEAPDALYDMIFLDAFSSDNIPIHILTKEAFAIYLRKLKPNGIIVANLSNRYLYLDPVVEGIARNLGLHAVYRKSLGDKIKGNDKIEYAPISFVVMARDMKTIQPLLDTANWQLYDGKEKPKAWTDTYADILSIFMVDMKLHPTDRKLSKQQAETNSP